MVIEYRNSFDDYQEAYAAHWHSAQDRKTSIRDAWPALVFMGYCIACIAAADFLDRKFGHDQLAISMLLLFPMILISVMEMVYPIIPRARQPRKIRLLLSWFIVLVAGAAAAILCTFAAGPVFWRMTWKGLAPYFTAVFLLPHLTWIVHSIIVRTAARLAQRRSIRKGWSQSDLAEQSTTLETTSMGILIRTSTTRSEIFWPGLPLFRETANLFMIYISQNSYLMVPKRAIADPAATDDFRRLLVENITHRRSAFEVIPIP